MLESGEMYLENILVLTKKNGGARAVDLAAAMHISKASVSRALTKLKAEECINVEADGRLVFTQKGLDIAEKIYERHRILTQLIVGLGVDEETAMADACKIEHDISDRTFEAIKAHIMDKK